MKKAKFLLPCAVFAVAIIVASCSKDGSAGPAGPAGPAGAAGATGAAGPAGAAGTANVIYSAWDSSIVFNPIIPTPGDTVGYVADITASKLDLNILNTGEIKVYIKAGTAADPTVFAIPYNDGQLFIDAVFYLNTIELSSNGDLTGAPFRYILVPGGTTARTTKTVDWKNYASVQKYLGLKD